MKSRVSVESKLVGLNEFRKHAESQRVRIHSPFALFYSCRCFCCPFVFCLVFICFSCSLASMHVYVHVLYVNCGVGGCRNIIHLNVSFLPLIG